MTDEVAPVLLAVGETMALVVPARAEPLETATEIRLDIGGAESNVAMHVARLGHRARWFSRVGNDDLGRRLTGSLARAGVNVEDVIVDDHHPTGLYVKSPGGRVVYYRKGSAASKLSMSDADAAPLDGVTVLHVSGITAALSPAADLFLLRLVERARANGVLVSVDVNYRASLWLPAEAAPALLRLAQLGDIIFVGRDEAEALWETTTVDDVRRLLPDVPELIVKDGDIGATAYLDQQVGFVPARRIDVIEPVGAGDAFAGGYLAARLSGRTVSDRLQAGHDRAALTLLTTTDFPHEDQPA